ncbi:MAG: YkuS family protein [Bacillota bacterium]
MQNKNVIAVDSDLKTLQDDLTANGYSVVELNDKNVNTAAAIIVSGMEENLMSIQDIQTKVPVINAHGKTNEEIMKDIENRMKKIH